ncbi:GntR family transcriptional regulator [Cellulomonas bogoriensis]|uniref:GntR family transcriptional regulator n=1 Tax=Cellulomonas bogoriensis 69B4 = DSM 16987 TaxID=1386082 RepID=A0A0A0BME5_9CELL|nr:GntR family transcriptional regulator [Cellulomonas bogoriensis]KGM09085.1 GntR family transcriptional regulator [Cellulomonas bogoriensis 69B4 = DSM 16987]
MQGQSTTTSSGASLVRQVTDMLREDIVARRFEPGQRLTETRLADHYGVSRVPVREALRLLEGEGLVTTTGPRVRTVSRWSDQDALDLFAVRATVESLTAARAATGATPAQLRGIRALLAAGQEAFRAGEFESLPGLNTDLHRAIAEASGSPMLLGLFNQISHKVSLLYRATVDTRAPSSWSEHAEIVDAIVDQDPERARRLMLAHIETSAALTSLQGGPATADPHVQEVAP